jgi:hypothetical protein
MRHRVCDISGWRTRTVSFVPGPNVGSANPQRRNSARASTAARPERIVPTTVVVPATRGVNLMGGAALRTDFYRIDLCNCSARFTFYC